MKPSSTRSKRVRPEVARLGRSLRTARQRRRPRQALPGTTPAHRAGRQLASQADPVATAEAAELHDVEHAPRAERGHHRRPPRARPARQRTTAHPPSAAVAIEAPTRNVIIPPIRRSAHRLREARDALEQVLTTYEHRGDRLAAGRTLGALAYVFWQRARTRLRLPRPGPLSPCPRQRGRRPATCRSTRALLRDGLRAGASRDRSTAGRAAARRLVALRLGTALAQRDPEQPATSGPRDRLHLQLITARGSKSHPGGRRFEPG